MLPPLVEKKLQEAVERHAELENQLGDGEILAKPALYRKISRECGALGKLVSTYHAYLKTRREIEENETLVRESSDPELSEMAKEEVERLRQLEEEQSSGLLERVLVEDKDADRNVIVEIRAGTGGNEAALFVADLFRMYSKYAEREGWKIELIDSNPTDLGGFREIIFSVAGDAVYRDLRYEMGGHRVQRVPTTEASGRIHTSAATVAVLGEPEEVEVEINENELRVDFYRAGGPGGQKVNKTSSAVRVTHIPTGIVVAIQDEVSQHKNRAKAMRVLRSRLYDFYEKQRLEREQRERRHQIGTGDRNQRVRTYNFPQNRVTDHRIGKNFNLERIVKEGDLAELTNSLRGYDRDQRLQALDDS